MVKKVESIEDHGCRNFSARPISAAELEVDPWGVLCIFTMLIRVCERLCLIMGKQSEDGRKDRMISRRTDWRTNLRTKERTGGQYGGQEE